MSSPDVLNTILGPFSSENTNYFLNEHKKSYKNSPILSVLDGYPANLCRGFTPKLLYVHRRSTDFFSGRASYPWKFQHFRSSRWYQYYFIKCKCSILILLLETMRQIVVWQVPHQHCLLGTHIVVSEWSIVLNLTNEEEILPQDDCKMETLILPLHQ